MNIDLISIQNAVNSLEKAVMFVQGRSKENISETEFEVLKAGVIQNFEFTYELCWKFMKRWLENNVASYMVDGVARRELFRLSAASHLIDDIEKWMEFHHSRNLTSHTYNKNYANEIFEKAIEFLPYSKKLLSELEQKQ